MNKNFQMLESRNMSLDAANFQITIEMHYFGKKLHRCMLCDLYSQTVAITICLLVKLIYLYVHIICHHRQPYPMEPRSYRICKIYRVCSDHLIYRPFSGNTYQIMRMTRENIIPLDQGTMWYQQSKQSKVAGRDPTNSTNEPILVMVCGLMILSNTTFLQMIDSTQQGDRTMVDVV